MTWVRKNIKEHRCSLPIAWPWRRDWVWECDWCHKSYRLEDTGWYSTDLEWKQQFDPVQVTRSAYSREISELTEAIRLTVEYVGTDMLPPIEGWDWFDVMVRYDPETAKRFLQEYVPLEDRPIESFEKESCGCGGKEHTFHEPAYFDGPDEEWGGVGPEPTSLSDLTDKELRAMAFVRLQDRYRRIAQKHKGIHNPEDIICIVLGKEPVENAYCNICREASFLIDPDYAAMSEIREVVEEPVGWQPVGQNEPTWLRYTCGSCGEEFWSAVPGGGVHDCKTQGFA